MHRAANEGTNLIVTANRPPNVAGAYNVWYVGQAAAYVITVDVDGHQETLGSFSRFGPEPAGAEGSHRDALEAALDVLAVRLLADVAAGEGS